MSELGIYTWSEKISLVFLILKVFCATRALYCVVFGFYTDGVFWTIIALFSGVVAFFSHYFVPRIIKRLETTGG